MLYSIIQFPCAKEVGYSRFVTKVSDSFLFTTATGTGYMVTHVLISHGSKCSVRFSQPKRVERVSVEIEIYLRERETERTFHRFHALHALRNCSILTSTIKAVSYHDLTHEIDTETIQSSSSHPRPAP